MTGLAYLALYREAENERRAADELRRTRAELSASQHDAGVLAERERLAREIHDTLAQGFSSIALVARAGKKSLADGDATTAAARFALVEQTASENLAEARNGDPMELPQPYRVTLLRAAQASLANVRDHARASKAVVTVAFLGSEVTMDIYDDGVGFVPAGLTDHMNARTDGSGFGIRSLQQRVTALNGSLDLEAAPGKGQ